MTPTAVALMATVLLRIAVVAVVPVAAGSPIVAHLAETSFVVRPLAMPGIELLLLAGETAFPVIAVAHPAAIIRICHDRPLNFRSCRSRPVSRARQPARDTVSRWSRWYVEATKRDEGSCADRRAQVAAERTTGLRVLMRASSIAGPSRARAGFPQT